MLTLPLSLPLDGARLVIVGGGDLARRKHALAHAGAAAVEVFAGPDGREDGFAGATVHSRWPLARDLAGAALVIVATERAVDQDRFAALARTAGRLVNVVDRPDLSDVHIPAIVDRGDIVIGIASGGTAPVLARDVRAAVEAAVPASVRPLAAFARTIRAMVRAARPAVADRRAAWERILRGPAAEAARRGDAARAQALAAADLASAEPPRGTVHLVGAGPGDPELLTLRALRLLQDADLIVHDRLVDARILDMARRDADRIYVGKARSRHCVPQQDINALLIAAARAGKRVVRLKGGDPFVFGRGGEELDALRAAGIEAHVTPGITAALGCAAGAGAALTHRDYAQAVTFVTGHAREEAGEAEPRLDWRALAAANHTVVVYMGGARAEAIARRLIEAGRAPATATLIVENGTRADERRTLTTLAALGAALRAHAQGGPALLIIGEAAARADAADALTQNAFQRAA